MSVAHILILVLWILTIGFGVYYVKDIFKHKEDFKEVKYVPTIIIGVLANFFDTLGIGSYAPTSAAFKFGKSVDDINVPGTLNVGDTFPVCLEAFFFFGFVELAYS